MIRTIILASVLIEVCLIVPGCTTSPATNRIASDDHRGLAEWYEQEAVRHRERAAYHRQMIRQYYDPSYRPSPKITREELIAHCDTFINYYSKAAEQAGSLAAHYLLLMDEDASKHSEVPHPSTSYPN